MTKYVKLAEIQIQDLNARSGGGRASDAFSEGDKSAQIIPSFVYIGFLSLLVICILLFLFKKALELSDYVANLRKLRHYELNGSVYEKIEYMCISCDGGNDLTLATQDFAIVVGSRESKKNYAVKGLSIASFRLPDFLRVVVQTTEGFYVPGNNDIELCGNLHRADPSPDEKVYKSPAFDASNPPRQFLVYGILAFSLALVAFQYAVMYSGYGYFSRSDTSITWYSRYIVMGISTTLLVYTLTVLGTRQFTHRVVQIAGLFNLLVYAFLAASAAVYYESQTLYFVPSCVFLVLFYGVFHYNFWDVLLNMNGGSTLSNWIPKKNIWFLIGGFLLQAAYLIMVALSTDLYGVINPTSTYWTLGALEISIILFYSFSVWQAVERKELHQANTAILLCGIRGNFKEALDNTNYAITLAQKGLNGSADAGASAKGVRQKANGGVLSSQQSSDQPPDTAALNSQRSSDVSLIASTLSQKNAQMRQRTTQAVAVPSPVATAATQGQAPGNFNSHVQRMREKMHMASDSNP